MKHVATIQITSEDESDRINIRSWVDPAHQPDKPQSTAQLLANEALQHLRDVLSAVIAEETRMQACETPKEKPWTTIN